MTDRPPRTCPFGFGTAPPAGVGAPSPARRRLLLGLGAGAAGGALALGGAATRVPATAATIENDGTQARQPFYGSRQPGIVTAQPAAALLVAFDILADSRAELERLMRVLTDRIAFLMAGGAAETADPLLPLGDGISIDDLAARAGTIGYEVLTKLGLRSHRRAVGG